MVTRVIKTDAEYEAILAEVEGLVHLDPAPGTPDAERLELLSLLVRNYESKRFPIGRPDPIEAIEFRMEQQGLTQRDLIAYMGSRSKVSEVLSRKRPLTLSMIRAIHEGLGIPAEVLLQKSPPELPEHLDIPWDRFPIPEMIKRRWLKIDAEGLRKNPELFMRSFLKPLEQRVALEVLYRRTISERSARKMDKYALFAWTARILIRALDKSLPPYSKGTVTLQFMREVARFSWSDKGPLLAREFLASHGIHMIIEPNLPRTHLDAAALLADLGGPVVALTIRHDRIDSFWFCLMHELAHISLHLMGSEESFVDDLDSEIPDDPREREADELASEALIPMADWLRSRAYRQQTTEAIQEIAKTLRIHPAIVAGRIRHTTRNYRVLNQLVGHGRVRQLFPEVTWS